MHLLPRETCSARSSFLQVQSHWDLNSVRQLPGLDFRFSGSTWLRVTHLLLLWFHVAECHPPAASLVPHGWESPTLLWESSLVEHFTWDSISALRGRHGEFPLRVWKSMSWPCTFHRQINTGRILLMIETKVTDKTHMQISYWRTEEKVNPSWSWVVNIFYYFKNLRLEIQLPWKEVWFCSAKKFCNYPFSHFIYRHIFVLK